MILKRYLVFAGPKYYPFGGWEDFVGSYDSIDQAKDALLNKDTLREGMGPPHTKYAYVLGDFDWYHIIDTTTGLRAANSEQ